jgi:multisubunit Na+/H+ antiporter MnhE subunit
MMQKLGGYASIISILVVAAAIGLMALTLPRLGLSIQSSTVPDPLKVMAAYEASPMTFRAMQAFGVLIAIALILVALALQERMRANAPGFMRLAVIAASVAFALLLANTIGGTPGMLSIASNKDVSAYRAFTLVQNGLSAAAVNAWGWALLLMGWAAIRTRALPRILSYIILVCGIVAIIGFAVPAVTGVVGSVIGYVVVLLNVIGALWLGAVLVKKPEPSMAVSA